MISIPMLLTRRGWLGWATPYFLSLFLRLTSLHAPRPQFSSSFPRPLQPSSDPLAIFYSVIFASLPFTPSPHPIPFHYLIPPFFLCVAFLLPSSSRSRQFRPLSGRREDRVVDIERWKGIGGSQGNSKTKLNEMSASMRDTQILISRESHESFQLNSMLTPDGRLISISFHWEMHRFCRSVYSSSPRDRNRKSISGLIILIHRLFKRVPNVR